MSNIDIGAVGNRNIGAVQESAPVLDNEFDILVAELELQTYSPSYQVGKDFTIPVVAIQLAKFSPNFNSTEYNFSTIPTASINIDAFSPNFESTLLNSYTIPTAELEVQTFSPNFDATADTSVIIPLAQIIVDARNIRWKVFDPLAPILGKTPTFFGESDLL